VKVGATSSAGMIIFLLVVTSFTVSDTLTTLQVIFTFTTLAGSAIFTGSTVQIGATSSAHTTGRIETSTTVRDTLVSILQVEVGVTSLAGGGIVTLGAVFHRIGTLIFTGSTILAIFASTTVITRVARLTSRTFVVSTNSKVAFTFSAGITISTLGAVSHCSGTLIFTGSTILAIYTGIAIFTSKRTVALADTAIRYKVASAFGALRAIL